MTDNNTLTRRQLFDECVSLLNIAGKESAEFDTMCIFQDMLGDKNPLFSPLKAVTAQQAETIRALAAKRAKGHPLQYLLGEWEFYGLPFKVGEGVLIPRPDTETLIDHVLDICREKGLTAPVITDLCSGSGCIAIALEKHLPGAEVYAVELSEKALYYLRQNKELNRSAINIIEGDVLKAETAASLPQSDIIVSNPPYLTTQDMAELEKEVTFEPASALFGGNDGLGFYRAISSLWRSKIKNGGFIAYEFGMGQHDEVKNILLNSRYGNFSFRQDGGDIIRTIAADKNGSAAAGYTDTSQRNRGFLTRSEE